MEGIEIRNLSPQAVHDIGAKLDVSKDWKHLAFYCIGSSHIETREIEYNANKNHQSPTSCILEKWMEHNATATVNNLITHLKAMNRLDVVNVIQELWQDNLLGRVTTPRLHQMDAGSSPSWSGGCTHQHQSVWSHPDSSLSSINSGVSASPFVVGSWHCPTQQHTSGNRSTNSMDKPPMSSISNGTYGRMCVAPGPWNSAQNSQHTSQHTEHSDRAHKLQTRSTFLNGGIPEKCNPSNSFSTWPKKSEKLVASYTPRPWSSTTQSSTEQRPAPGNSVPHAAAVEHYIYDGPGLQSHQQAYKGHVFITYSAASSKYIQLIHNALQLEGYSVLTDVKRSVIQQPQSKMTEEEFHAMLVKGVENCKYVLCLLCEDYMRELKGHDPSQQLMNIQFINQLMNNEFKEKGKKNMRFIPFCLNESMTVASLPPYLMNFPLEIQEPFVTAINKVLGRQKSDLLIYRVENKTKKHKFRFLKKR